MGGFDLLQIVLVPQREEYVIAAGKFILVHIVPAAKLGACLQIIRSETLMLLFVDESKPFTWAWMYSEERFERPHLEAYKITLHQSYREGCS